ncbi:hypothetical protein [Alkalihalobacillus trypoxylicola]|uniref:Uncharacterized protein n=1 Tax=Alkalihalobacillus trypoxylicola TaxID=519424 RepID=A0A161Q1I9_9BACI|nr:hypothetical protein [Alkalihalobacillus trypoxylicola]KYG34851.1 hypothetical protein AZF04_00510 [Alkalihalobacillus trypoxylicola]
MNWKKLSVTVAAFFIIAGCSTNEEGMNDDQGIDTDDEPEVIDQEDSIEEEEVEGDNDNNEESSNEDGSESTDNTEEATDEDQSEEQADSGQYEQSDSGYEVYVLNDYVFTPEEPRRDQIYVEDDGLAFTRIISNGPEAEMDLIKDNIIEFAEGQLIEDVEIPMDGLEYSLLVEDEEVKTYYFAKSYGSDILSFEMFIPVNADSERVEEEFWTMVDSLSFP